MRPRLDRTTVRGLDGSDPRIDFADGTQLGLDDPAAPAAFEQEHVIAVEGEQDRFLVIRERRGRGGLYWVARGYRHGVRASSYIGPQLSLGVLRRAAADLSVKLGIASDPPSASRTTEEVQEALALLSSTASSDPAAVRAVEVLRRLAERSTS